MFIYAFVGACDLPDSNWSSYEDSILHFENLDMSIGSTWLTLYLLQETCLSTDDCAKVDEYSLKRSVLLYIYIDMYSKHVTTGSI